MPEIKRVNYFTSQFLKEEEFKDEQTYHMGMRRLHNRSLHTWGVVDGLVVSGVAGQKSVTVSPGIAIDSKGREIVLPSDPPPQPIDLSAVTRGTDALITIAYRDVQDPADKYTTAGVEGKFKRTTERPLVAAEASPPADGSVVILARVSVDAAGNIGAPNNAVRRLASAVVAPDLDVRSLKWGNNSRLQTDQGGSIELGGDNSTAGGGTPYIDFHFLGKTEDFNARIINDADGRLSLQVPVLRAMGSVGIGTPTPGAKLTVQQGPTAAGAAANGKGLFVSAAMGSGATSDGGIEFRHDNLTQGIGFGFNTIYATGSNPNQDLAIQSRGTGSVLLNPSLGNVGIGSLSPPKAKLQVSGGAIMPTSGNSAQAGIQFPPDPGGGGGDEAYIRYFQVSGEATKLLIGIGNDADDTIGLFQAGAERMTIQNGNVGIGTSTPDGKLQLLNAAQDANGNTLIIGPTNGAHLRLGYHTDYSWIQSHGSKPLQINPLGNCVGVGPVVMPSAQGRLMASGGTAEIGFLRRNLAAWPAQPVAGDRFLWWTPDGSSARLWTEGMGDLLSVNTAGDVSFRGALRVGGSDIYFTQTDHTHTGIGNAAGFAAIENDGGQFKCLMILGRMVPGVGRVVKMWDSVEIAGNLKVGGAKTGFVVDQFVNKYGDTIEIGDVVVIGDGECSLYEGLNDNIPIPEIDLAASAYDSRVCGIVCEVVGALESEPKREGKPDAKSAKSSQTKARKQVRQRPLDSEEMEGLDRTKVQPDQIGTMVTLGAFAHCKVDADIAPIKMGDLLTTSPTKGHAQKVLDASKATGAIIGKALGSLKKGKGKISVLVTLQ